MPVSHPSRERVLTISLFTSEKVCVFKNRDSRAETKMLYSLYFLSVFREINVGEGNGGNSSNDIPIPGTMAYFKRCIEEHANVIATASLPESSH